MGAYFLETTSIWEKYAFAIVGVCQVYDENIDGRGGLRNIVCRIHLEKRY